MSSRNDFSSAVNNLCNNIKNFNRTRNVGSFVGFLESETRVAVNGKSYPFVKAVEMYPQIGAAVYCQFLTPNLVVLIGGSGVC